MGITLFPVGAGGSGGGETDLKRLDVRMRDRDRCKGFGKC